MTGRPRTLQIQVYEWRCLLCAASGHAITDDLMIRAWQAHYARVHSEQPEA